MRFNRRTMILLAIALVCVALVVVAIVNRHQGTQSQKSVNHDTLTTPNTMNAAQKADAAAGEAVVANRKNLAPGSDKVTESTNPQQNVVTMHFDDGKLISAADVHVKVNQNLKLVVTTVNQDDEIDLIIPDFVQRATFSQNSDNALEFTPGVKGSFPIYLQPEESDRSAVGHLVVE